jgi:hypothetical protein
LSELSVVGSIYEPTEKPKERTALIKAAVTLPQQEAKDANIIITLFKIYIFIL